MISVNCAGTPRIAAAVAFADMPNCCMAGAVAVNAALAWVCFAVTAFNWSR
ncbi:hypothetical protein D3C72_2042260 [compost metagenome]